MNVRASRLRRIAISTGRNATVASGSTIPCTEQGTPSRNGSTRTRSQCRAKKVRASARSSALPTQRTKLPPPWKPSRASPAHTTSPPTPPIASLASSRAPFSAGTTRLGACATPAASHSSSAYTLSSSAMNAAGRPPVTGRPSTGSSVVTNGWVTQTPARSGSKASTRSTTSGGRPRTRPSRARSSSVTVADGGVVTSTTSARSGTGPAPRAVDSTITFVAPASSSIATVLVNPASTPGPTSTGRPAYLCPRWARSATRSASRVRSRARSASMDRRYGPAPATRTPLSALRRGQAYAGGPCRRSRQRRQPRRTTRTAR